MMQRQRFAINTDTGTQGDTGPNFHGEIRQIGWAPTTADTGAALYIALLPVDALDTAGGLTLLNDEDCLGASFIRAPMIPGVASDGFDTGVDQYAPAVAAGDRLRIKVTPGGAAVAGTLYVWTREF
jgi:hypothetical protein